MKNLQQLHYTARGWEHRQLMLPMDTEILIPADDPVRLASAQLEELDYSKLYRAYSPKGRKSAAEPRIIFKVLVYGYMSGIYSSRKLEEMGETDRNSYSRTDHDATFMRLKEDHMRNGQLKPGYNMQIAVNSEYITGVAAYPNRTDSGTLIPFLKELEHGHRKKYLRIVANVGYESQDNYLYLDSHEQMSFIKPQNYE